MLVKEKLSNIFTEIELIKPLAIFDFIDSETLETLYILKHGNRSLNSKGEEIEINKLAKVLNIVFGEKWDKILLNYTESILELNSYSEKIIETISDDGSLNLTRDSINKISAYNVDEFVNNNSDENIESNMTTNLRNRQYEIQKIKDTGYFDKINNYLNKVNIYDIIYTDINELVTLSIYK